jgi:hypothetical protein
MKSTEPMSIVVARGPDRAHIGLMLIRCFRVHPAGESPETVLDVRRPDGWVASDESYATQPQGVSVCHTLDDLRWYIRAYQMAVQPGDVVLEVLGEIVGHDRDCLQASRVRVASIEAVHPATILAEPADEDEDEDETA